MKREFAVIAAALLILSACGANDVQEKAVAAPVEAETTSQTQNASSEAPMNDADAPVHMETVPSEEMQTKPIAPETHFSESFTDEPYEFQADLEEVVSISLTLPHFTLDSDEAADVINQTFVDLQKNLQNYMGTTVYETAQARHTIGFLEGSYTASLENGILSVTYTVTEWYADDDGAITHENVYRFDTSNGERLDA
jgi:hypothetical protein